MCWVLSTARRLSYAGERGLNVTQAIALAWGTGLQASVGTIRLIRKVPDGKVQRDRHSPR